MEEDLSPFQVGLYEQGAKLGHQEWVQIEGGWSFDGSKHVANEELRSVRERGYGGNPKVSMQKVPENLEVYLITCVSPSVFSCVFSFQ